MSHITYQTCVAEYLEFQPLSHIYHQLQMLQGYPIGWGELASDRDK